MAVIVYRISDDYLTSVSGARSSSYQPDIFQQTLLKLVSDFISVSRDGFDHVVNEALRMVGQYCKADRLYIYSYEFEHEIAINTNEWCAEDFTSPINVSTSIPFSKLTAIINCHIKGEIVYVSILSETAKQDKKTHLLFPMIAQNQCFGFVGLELAIGKETLMDKETFLLKALVEMLSCAELRCRSDSKIAYMSMYDYLTGLYNRAYFEEELKRLHHSREYPITMIYADVDGLKVANDAFGHEKGDELLKMAANLMRQSLRSPEVFARIGGDEFAAVLVKTDEKAGQKIINRIKNKVAIFNLTHQDIPLSISIGLATASNSDISLVDLLTTADDFMYRDKMFKGKTDHYSESAYFGVGHSKRLDHICRALGEKLDLEAKQVTDLSLLVKAHNLGKAGISKKILYKQGKLSKEEQNIICLHPEKGYRIALTSLDLSEIADLILKHHEWWDGNGYPLGLKGDQIPIECRILSVADAFSAMTTGRVYKKALTSTEALEELRSCAGTQFDPQVVEAFYTLYEETRWLLSSDQG